MKKLLFKKVVVNLVIVILLILQATSNAQEPTFQTPENYSFMKYGEFPINNYTGSPDISFNLFSIKEKGIEIPITLSYVGGGVKVSDLSTWVGLGWNLHPEGTVTQIKMGSDWELWNQDVYEDLIGWANSEMEQIFLYDDAEDSYGRFCGNDLSEIFGFYGSCNQVIHTGQGYNFYNELSYGHYFQPDIFSFSFLGYSFKFYINPVTEEPVIIDKKENHVIVDLRNSSSEEKGWKIILPTGIQVCLYDQEIITSGYLGIGDYSRSLTWKVSYVVLNNGDTINFEYEDYDYQLYSLSDNYSYNYIGSDDETLNLNVWGGNRITTAPNGITQTNKKNLSHYETKCLKSIISSNSTVEFNLSTSFERPRLNYIDYYNNQYPDHKHRYRFNYENYNHSGSGWNLIYGSTTVGNALTYTKHKLLNLTESFLDGSTETSNPSYIFSYIENIGLPSIFSKAQDYWGFYNGANNAYLLCDETKIFPYNPWNIPSNYLSLIRSMCNADRTVDENYSKQGILNKVQYPTKGYSIFNFESHEFNCEEGHILTKQEQISYSGATYAPSEGAGLRISSIENYDENNVLQTKKKIDYDPGLHLQSMRFWKLKQTGICNGFYKSFTASASNIYVNPLVMNQITYGSVYVKDIAVVDGVEIGNINGQTIYEYYNDPVEYMYSELNVPRFSNLRLENGMMKRIRILDSSEQLVKRTEYINSLISSSDFTCIRADILYNCPETQGAMESNNAYYISFYPLNSESWKSTSVIDYEYYDGDGVRTEKTFTYGEDYLQLLKEEVESSVENKNVATTFKYSTGYDLPSSVTPQDDVEVRGLKAMVDNNMVGIPIETLTLVDDKVIGGQLNTYQLDSYGHIVPHKTFVLETSVPKDVDPNPDGTLPFLFNHSYTEEANDIWKLNIDDLYPDITDPNLEYTYDLYGNIVQVDKQDDISTSYLWGYDNSLPVAKVENADHDEVAYTSFEPGANGGNWYRPENLLVSGGITGERCLLTEATIPCTALLDPSKSYKLTFYAKGNNNILSISGDDIGVLNVNLSNEWDYYEVVLEPGKTSIEMEVGVYTYFDELRLYPSDAQMRSYTYDPLIGIISESDERGVPIHYIYDEFGRLIKILDQDRNVLKQYDYHYKDQ